MRIRQPISQIKLTTREIETLDLLAEGCSYKLIAHRLGISLHTAKFHVSNVLEKIGVDTSIEAAVAWALHRANQSPVERCQRCAKMAQKVISAIELLHETTH